MGAWTERLLAADLRARRVHFPIFWVAPKQRTFSFHAFHEPSRRMHIQVISRDQEVSRSYYRGEKE